MKILLSATLTLIALSYAAPARAGVMTHCVCTWVDVPAARVLVHVEEVQPADYIEPPDGVEQEERAAAKLIDDMHEPSWQEPEFVHTLVCVPNRPDTPIPEATPWLLLPVALTCLYYRRPRP